MTAELKPLAVTVKTTVTQSNLSDFKASAKAIIKALNFEPKNDEQFIEAKQDVKDLKEAEKRTEAAIQAIIDQSKELSAVIGDAREVKGELGEARLKLDKIVTEKEAKLKDNIVGEFVEKKNKLNDDFYAAHGYHLPPIDFNLREAGKGKRKLESFRSALNEVFIAYSAEVERLAENVRANRATLDKLPVKPGLLFPDLEHCIFNSAGTFEALTETRLERYELQQEREKLEAEKAEQEPEVPQEPQEPAPAPKVKAKAKSAESTPQGRVAAFLTSEVGLDDEQADQVARLVVENALPGVKIFIKA